MAITLKPHQINSVKLMHNGCILTGDVGSGKTIASLTYYYTAVCGGRPKLPGMEYKKMTTPRDLYVITTARKRDELDWEQEAAYFGLSRDGNESGVKIHVDGWNNITKYISIKDAFFIFDEQRLVGNGSWVKSFLKIVDNNEWIMLSATPGDNWMDYIAVFIANGFYKNRTEFIDRHVEWVPYLNYPKVNGFKGHSHLNGLRDRLLVPMPFERHTTRHVIQILAEYDNVKYKELIKNRWNFETEQPVQNISELFSLLRKITNQDVSRIGEIMKLLEKHPKLIIFYNYNYELGILRTLANTLDYPVSEWNGHKHAPIPQDDKWMYLVQYTSGAEGWNCIETDAMAFWSLTYSYKILHQCLGRIDRLNTPFTDLYYYIIRSSSPVDLGVWKAVVSKKDFNKNQYVKDTFGDAYLKGFTNV